MLIIFPCKMWSDSDSSSSSDDSSDRSHSRRNLDCSDYVRKKYEEERDFFGVLKAYAKRMDKTVRVTLPCSTPPLTQPAYCPLGLQPPTQPTTQGPPPPPPCKSGPAFTPISQLSDPARKEDQTFLAINHLVATGVVEPAILGAVMTYYEDKKNPQTQRPPDEISFVTDPMLSLV